MTPRFLPVGPRAFLVELPDLTGTLALFDALAGDPVPGLAEVIPAARTLMVRTVPGVAADGRLAAAIAARASRATARREDAAEAIEIPMAYDGEDLAEVAARLDLTVAEVIAAHQAATWQVAFCGFAPGFAYMTCEDPRFDLPRRASPRARIPAGAVGLAGRFCGVYPKASPGGWQLIGTTPTPMWDLARDPPALLRPGGRVRFVERRGAVHPTPAAPAEPPASVVGLRVVATAFPVLVQDAGRSGQAAHGISGSGAMDLPSLRRANRRAGNPPDAPALEITLGPTRLSVDAPATLVLDGAADWAEIEAGQARIPVDVSRPFALDPGEVLVIPPPPAACGAISRAAAASMRRACSAQPRPTRSRGSARSRSAQARRSASPMPPRSRSTASPPCARRCPLRARRSRCPSRSAPAPTGSRTPRWRCCSPRTGR